MIEHSRPLRTALCRSLVVGLSIGSAAAQFALHNGDRVVFYGDSITDNAPYTSMLENFVLTRFPKMNVRFFNAGVSGDRVTGGGAGPIDVRLDRDVFSRRPTVVTVMLGMNDGNYRAFDNDVFNAFRSGYAHIADRFRAQIPNARIWLIEPSPFDDFTRPYSGYNDVLKKFGAAVAELASARGYGLIDMNGPIAEAIDRAATTDPALAARLLPDRVHPNAAGHLLIAATIVKAWGAPRFVSRTEIDAKTGRAITDGVVVRSVRAGNRVTWTSTEDSLPFPFDRKDPVTNLVLRTSPIEDILGREVVVVHNLPAGNYRLSVDGQEVTKFSADTFNSGIDLSWLDTPMSRQAQRVAELTRKRVALKYFAWRNVEVGLSDLPAKPRAEAARSIERLEDDLIAAQHREATPKPHTFEVSPTE